MNASEASNLHDWAAANRDMLPHITTLTRYAKAARSIIELGTRGGVSTWAFLDGLPRDGELFSVDIEDCVVPARVEEDTRWTFIIGDDTLDETWDRLPDQVDIVFIDTSHTYEHTLLELEWAVTRDPAAIICHDAYWPGVKVAMEEFCAAHPYWHVHAVHEASDDRGDFSLAVLGPVS